jgi:hypothetical protein
VLGLFAMSVGAADHGVFPDVRIQWTNDPASLPAGARVAVINYGEKTDDPRKK